MVTSKYKGRLGLSMAINYFTLHGYTISLPLTDTQYYDLVVEKDHNFYKIQCKCTFTDDGIIKLTSSGGTNGSVYDNVCNHPDLDFLFCTDKNLQCWLIPLKDILESGVRNKISLRTEYGRNSHFRLDTTKYVVSL